MQPHRPADPSEFTLSAWLDESVIIDDRYQPGRYTLAAVVADTSECDVMRDRLRSLTLRRGGRLHWKAESLKRRNLIASTVADFDIAALVVSASPVARSKQERARRQCLERLLYELDQLGVSTAHVESRGTFRDRYDAQLMDVARDKGIVPNGVRLGFMRPVQEPMLWLADAVAGAVTASHLGSPEWLIAMSEVVTMYAIEAR
jgi:hypothetical protein